jgi:hypothetical protein
LTDLDRTQEAARRHWGWAQTAADHQDAYLNSVALNLHAFYSGLERLFDMIATDVDGGRPGGSDWHVELLRQMTLDLGVVRPPVMRRETWIALDDYRRFRHLIRNIYATNLDPSRVGTLVTGLSRLWEGLQTELETFAAFLDAVDQG